MPFGIDKLESKVKIISANPLKLETVCAEHFSLCSCLYHFANPIECDEIQSIFLQLNQRYACIIESNISGLHGNGF